MIPPTFLERILVVGPGLGSIPSSVRSRIHVLGGFMVGVGLVGGVRWFGLIGVGLVGGLDPPSVIACCSLVSPCWVCGHVG